MNWVDIKYFEASEFDSPDEPGSGYAHMKLDFVKKLDTLRGICGFPFIVASGYRTVAHNSELDAAVADSAHLLGRAADIVCRTSQQRLSLVRGALGMGFRRIGIDSAFIHLDDDATKPQDVLWLYK